MPRAKKESQQLTPLELKIMQVLWELGPSNVQAVQTAMVNDLAYTTVQTMLNVLERKKQVKRKLVGRAFVYAPLVQREAAAGTAVGDLLDRMFGGSVEGLLMNLVQTRQVDAAKLTELAKRVAIVEAKRHADSE